MRISDWSSDVCSSDLRRARFDMDRLSIVQTLTIESLEDIGRCASREAFEQDRLGAEADRKTGGMIVMGGAAALAARSRPVPAQALDDLLGANRCVDGD